jgi:hypothetical protein
MRRSAAADPAPFARPVIGWPALAAIAGLIALAGCAAPAASSKGRMLQYAAAASQAEAFRAADRTCNAYGRVAETVSYDGATQTLEFRCVEP